MPKIVIEILEDDINVTYTSNNNTTYPIVKVNSKEFTINKETDKSILVLVSNFIHQLGVSFRHQLIIQGIINNALNKPAKAK